MNRYKDRPKHASDGGDAYRGFAALCLKLLRDLLHETPIYCTDAKSQIEIGDTRQGDEFKHLQKSVNYLHIEIAERRDLDSQWVPSGIKCNRLRYMCGSDTDVFLFTIESLRTWLANNDPQLVWHGGNVQYRNSIDGRKFGTIESFILSKLDANEICIHRFYFYNNNWRLSASTSSPISNDLNPPPSLQELVRQYGGYYNVPDKAWKQWDQANINWRIQR